MKRVMAAILALVMAAVFMPAAVLAAVSVSLDKTVYLPNEKMVVTVTGVTQQMISDGAWVSVYPAGGSHYDFTDYDTVKAETNQVTLQVPAELGSYEVRLYGHYDVYDDTTLLMKVPFTVGAVQRHGKISLAKAAYLAGQHIPVTVTEITQEMERTEAYVGIYKKGAPHDQWIAYEYLKAGNSTVELATPNLNGDFEVRLYSINHNYTDESFVMSVPFSLSGAVEQPVSDWAAPEIAKAAALGLIPESLKTADLTKPITRAEFAAISVLLYEKLSGETAAPAATNPFRDTQDPEVLKAYNVGITAGVSADSFAPSDLLNREQAATMLTRVFKKSFVKGWTLEADDRFGFNYTAPPKFADDDKISDWAKPSVYFMVAHGILSGVGDNKFAPKAVTTAEQAANYASATREQALAIAVRMTEKLNADNASEIVPVNP